MPAVAAVSAALAIGQSVNAGTNGTWSPTGFAGNGTGTWSISTNWVGGSIADGASAIADFSTLNITSNSTITLDSSRTLGQLKFADTTQSHQWTLDNAGNTGNVLTLDNGASQPVITVGNGAVAGQNVTITSVIAGTNGFIKNGPGALTLSGSNTYSGVTTLNSGTSGLGADLYLANNKRPGHQLVVHRSRRVKQRACAAERRRDDQQQHHRSIRPAPRPAPTAP